VWRENVVKIHRADYEDVFWRETCFAWSAMMEMPTFEMPIMQPMLMAVSLKQHKQLPVAIPTFAAQGADVAPRHTHTTTTTTTATTTTTTLTLLHTTSQ
jgi:hypothetical protein